MISNKLIIKGGGLIALLVFFTLNATRTFGQGEIHGNFQIDAQYFARDTITGAQEVDEKLLSNSFANLIYTNQSFTAGVRYEAYINPMLTFEDYEGQGIAYRFASYKLADLEVTVGNYYEQFGNGLTFRSYEARNLGYDNVMDGVRLKYSPNPGIELKGIIGKQRLFWDRAPGLIRGADAEVSLNEMISGMAESKLKMRLGASVVSKFQEDDNPSLILPENVATFAGRTNITAGKVNVKAEYAYKYNDPSSDNGLIYKPGKAFFMTGNYSKKGFGLLFETKYLDNFSFRSDRYQVQNLALINYLPATTKQHTYNLAATLYPYATQLNGEMGVQFSMYKKFAKETALGGKYGTLVSINYSNVRNLNTNDLGDINFNRGSERLGYETNLAIGRIKYFRDFNIEVKKKFSKKVKTNFAYVSLLYNKAVVQGLPEFGTVKGNIAIADITWKVKPKHTLRFEAQGMVMGDLLELDLANGDIKMFELDKTEDLGHWAMGLVEYTFSPHWSISAMDQWNIGNVDADQRLHYWLFAFAYINKANRYALNVGRQREGLLCVGGVCRNVPAASGVTLSITSSF